MKFESIEQAIEWVTQRKNTGQGFEHFQRVMQLLENPQDDYPSIHIAGTNGKGSTAYYLSTALSAFGFKVGLFSSPHLVNHRDRIRINGEWISERDFLYYLNQFYDLIEAENLSMFEIDMLIASVYYRDKKVDWVVFEAGLGGRLDRTNVLSQPKLEIITTIGMDHMELLGDTLEKIAFEKAGIIKQNSKVLLGEIVDSASRVILEKASDMMAEVHLFRGFQQLSAQEFIYAGDTYRISSFAQYQKHNLALALQALEILGFDIHSEGVKQSLAHCLWKGRFETLCESPKMIVDGAHNLHGVEALAESIPYLPQPVYIVFAVLKDKQKEDMIACLKANCKKMYLTSFEMERAASQLNGQGCEFISDWRIAINLAKQQAKNEGSVLITGSLYFVSEVRAYLLPKCNK